MQPSRFQIFSLLLLLVTTFQHGVAYAQADVRSSPATVSAVLETGPAASRAGFTLQLGLGLGYASAGSVDGYGIYGLNVAVGAFVTPRVALLLRGTGLTTFRHAGTVTFGTGLGSVECFVTDDLTVTGGMGLMIASDTVERIATPRNPAFAISAAVGYTLANFGGSALRLEVEGSLGFFELTNVLNTGLALEYQLF